MVLVHTWVGALWSIGAAITLLHCAVGWNDKGGQPDGDDITIQSTRNSCATEHTIYIYIHLQSLPLNDTISEQVKNIHKASGTYVHRYTHAHTLVHTHTHTHTHTQTHARTHTHTRTHAHTHTHTHVSRTHINKHKHTFTVNAQLTQCDHPLLLRRKKQQRH